MKMRVLRMRRLLHVKADVLCTMLLLLLFCLLLYARQVALSSGWDKPVLKLEVHGSTSSSRTLLGADKEPGQTSSLLPACKPESRSKPRRRHGVVTETTPSRRLAPPPTLPLFDFDGYLRNKDNRDFRLLLDQPQKCRRGDGAPFLLVAVKSVAADFDKRQVVRRTWGREGTFQNGATVRTVFLLGVPSNRSALPLWDRLLTYESDTFGDVLLWDFDDTFFNLTLKETNFLNWVNSSCRRVKFIFKGDADVFVNIENILEMLKGQRSDEDLFVGDIIVNPKPIRRRSSKYYVPESVYGAMLYPNYAGGGGFVMSGHTARRLSGACRQVELFPIDDVFLGMCLQLIGVKPTRHQGFRTFGIPRPSAAPHLQTFDPCFYKDLMVVHGLGVPQIWLMWKLLHDPKLSCHSRGGEGVTATARRFTWRGKTETDYGDKRVFITH